MRVIALLIAGLICLVEGKAFAVLPAEFFPVDLEMRARVDFWKKVYTEISSSEAYIHDSEDMRIIYKKIDYRGLNLRAKSRLAEQEKHKIQQILRSIVKKSRVGLNTEEAQIFELIKHKQDSEILEMSHRIRRQQGMSDRYYEGLVRSFPYLDKMKRIFLDQGMPDALVFLPHVESSFNYKAYSKVGAAGMWQFMRNAARTYGLRMNYVVDERRDPIVSTKAAARFLRDNYAKLLSWPLALTAYNHGPKSIERAVQLIGTRNLSTIINKYENRRFGFASKNFYATFVATAEISEMPEKYFPNFPKHELPNFSEFSLQERMSMDQVAKITGYSKDQLQEFNLALRPSVFRSGFYLPKNFSIRIPLVPSERLQELAQKVAVIQKETSREGKAQEFEHTVQSGDSLYTIAKQYGAEMTDIIYLNSIASPSQIRPGMKLKVASAGAKSAKNLVASAVKPTPKKVELLAGDSKILSLDKVKELVDMDLRTIAPLSKVTDEAAFQEADIKEPGIIAEEKQGSAVSNFFSLIKDKLLGQSEKVGQIAGNAQATPIINPKPKFEEFDPSAYNFDMEKVKSSLYRVTVEVNETLGHFAEWAGTSPAQLRQINRLSSRSNIRQGQKLLITLNEDSALKFNMQRIRYHQAIEEDLYLSYKVSGIVNYAIERGDTIAGICKKLDVPFWLLRKYQPGISENKLVVGETIRIPTLVPVKESDAPPTQEHASDTAER